MKLSTPTIILLLALMCLSQLVAGVHVTQHWGVGTVEGHSQHHAAHAHHAHAHHAHAHVDAKDESIDCTIYHVYAGLSGLVAGIWPPLVPSVPNTRQLLPPAISVVVNSFHSVSIRGPPSIS